MRRELAVLEEILQLLKTEEGENLIGELKRDLHIAFSHIYWTEKDMGQSLDDLKAAVAALNSKVDQLLSQQQPAPPPPPATDADLQALTDAVKAESAKVDAALNPQPAPVPAAPAAPAPAPSGGPLPPPGS